MSGGGTIGDFMSMGYLPAQHHDSEYDEVCRGVMFMARRIRSTDKFEAPEIEDNSTGDWLGLNLWSREGNKRDTSGWSGSWACVVSSASSVKPSTPGKTITAEDRGQTGFRLHPNAGQEVPDWRFQAKEPSFWPNWHSNMPVGWPGTLNTGSDEYVQEEIFAPSFVGLVAANRGSSDFSTNVVDLIGSGVDDENYAPLHSLVSVEQIANTRGDMGLMQGSYLALQMGTTGQGDLNSGGLAVFGDTLATLARASGGPLTASIAHNVGATDEAPILAAALQTEALWRQHASSNVGPLEFHGVLGSTGGGPSGDVTITAAGHSFDAYGNATRTNAAGPGVLLSGGAPELTRVQAKILYNPDAPYQFGAETRQGTWQIWVDCPIMDDSVPLPGDAGSTTTRPHPPKDLDPAGQPYGGLGILGAAGGALGGGSVAGGAAGFPFGGISGPATGGRNPLSGFGIPSSGGSGGPRRNPLGGFGLPGSGGRGFGGPGDGAPRHTDHGRRPPSTTTQKRRAREAAREKSRQERVEKLMKKLDDNHPAKKNWKRKKAREKERQEQKDAKQKERKRKREQKAKNKKQEKARKAAEKEARSKARKERQRNNRHGHTVDGKFPGQDSGKTVPKSIHGKSLGGPGLEEFAVLAGAGGYQPRTYSMPAQLNLAGGAAFSALAFGTGQPDLAGLAGVGLGATQIADLRKQPRVAQIIGFGGGGGSLDEFEYTAGGKPGADGTKAVADGTIALFPGGYDPHRYLRGEDQDPEVSTTAKAGFLIPSDIAEMAFGTTAAVGELGAEFAMEFVDSAGEGVDTAIKMAENLITLDAAKVDITGRLDPTTLEFTPQATSAIPVSAFGLDVLTANNELYYSKAGLVTQITNNGILASFGGGSSLLDVVTGVDFTTGGTVNLHTSDASGSFSIVTHVVVHPQTIVSLTVDPIVGVGVAAGEDDIIAPVTIPGLTANIAYTIHAGSKVATPFGAQVIKLGIDTAATATTLLCDVYVFGFKTNITPGFDGSAIHDNVNSEISAITAKATPTTADFLLIEDAAASNAKKRITLASLPAVAGVDSTAIHNNAAAEISAITAKATPTTADFLLIEDAADSDNKKRVTVGDLPVSNFEEGAKVWDTNATMATITTGVVSGPLLFDSEKYDTNAWHSVSTNTGRITVPDSGVYLITGQVAFAAHATGLRTAYIFIDGFQRGASWVNAVTSSGERTIVPVTTMAKMTAGQYAEIYTRQKSGGNLGILGGSANNTSFSVQRIA